MHQSAGPVRWRSAAHLLVSACLILADTTLFATSGTHLMVVDLR
jgi:hypothetical protein